MSAQPPLANSDQILESVRDLQGAANTTNFCQAAEGEPCDYPYLHRIAVTKRDQGRVRSVILDTWGCQTCGRAACALLKLWGPKGCCLLAGVTRETLAAHLAGRGLALPPPEVPTVYDKLARVVAAVLAAAKVGKEVVTEVVPLTAETAFPRWTAPFRQDGAMVQLPHFSCEPHAPDGSPATATRPHLAAAARIYLPALLPAFAATLGTPGMRAAYEKARPVIEGHSAYKDLQHSLAWVTKIYAKFPALGLAADTRKMRAKVAAYALAVASISPGAPALRARPGVPGTPAALPAYHQFNKNVLDLMQRGTPAEMVAEMDRRFKPENYKMAKAPPTALQRDTAEKALGAVSTVQLTLKSLAREAPPERILEIAPPRRARAAAFDTASPGKALAGDCAGLSVKALLDMIRSGAVTALELDARIPGRDRCHVPAQAVTSDIDPAMLAHGQIALSYWTHSQLNEESWGVKPDVWLPVPVVFRRHSEEVFLGIGAQSVKATPALFQGNLAPAWARQLKSAIAEMHGRLKPEVPKLEPGDAYAVGVGVAPGEKGQARERPLITKVLVRLNYHDVRELDTWEPAGYAV